MHPDEKILYKTLLVAFVVVGTIISCFVLFVIWQQRRFKLMNTQKIRDQVNILEYERERIAEDLHDELGPNLSAIKYMIESLDSFSPDEKGHVQRCIQLIEAVIAKIRKVSNGLVSNTLIHNGLEAAINEFITIIQGVSPLKISTDIYNLHRLPVNARIHVFRIIQEITHNTIKHAKAKNLKIEMYSGKKSFFILTADDGCGFNTRLQSNKEGLGLNNIKNRVNLLQGTAGLKSILNQGTCYNIEIPFKQQPQTSER